MASTKAALKAAKAALDAQKYDEAVTQAEKALNIDANNYHANVFLGLALDKQGKHEGAEKAYNSAIKIKNNDALAWQGLISLYEKQGSKYVDQYGEAVVRLTELYIQADDKDRCQTIVDKFELFAKQNGTRDQYRKALGILLPGGPVFDYLEGRIPHPAHTFTRIAEIIEAEEKERINKEIGERRTRLGAKIGQVTIEVKREVLSQSPLEQIYQSIIDWSHDDDVRYEYEEKLLKHAYDTLVALPTEHKETKRIQVESIARGFVILKHPFRLAWEVFLEWKDFESLQEFDVGILRDFLLLFPEDGLSQVLKAFLGSDISPFPQQPAAENEGAEEVDEEIGTEERLLLMTDGLDNCSESFLAHRLVAEYYLHLEEYDGAVDIVRKGRALITIESQKSGLQLQNTLDSINTILATALIHYQSPKNHPEARTLFDEIIQRKPNATEALIGVGLILEEQEEFDKAIDFFERALKRVPDNVTVKAEAAWCKALIGDYSTGLSELEECLENIETVDQKSRDLKGQTLYRTGVCLWELDSSKSARRDRKGAYARWIAALQANIDYAPAYTSLGVYYADYGKDRKRARKCFQKAFELSSSEVEAAERLARAFADQSDWDLVEIVSRRVADSGRAKPAPGSKRKGLSWPFAALGVAELNKQEYQKSIASFQTALRISPDDYHSWVGLGESYHNSGRYIAATRAFQQADKFEEEVEKRKTGESWFAKYMLANVKRELGEYEEAVDGYNRVLQLRPGEFGVSVALLQTLVEYAWRSIEMGYFGRSTTLASRALEVAESVPNSRPKTFNLWKAIGDACSIYTWAQSHCSSCPIEKVRKMLETDIDTNEYQLFSNIDSVGKDTLSTFTDSESLSVADRLGQCIQAAILAQKRAIYCSNEDIHAQAVAWYNLGWTEQRAHQCLSKNTSSRYLKAAVRCFKRAIELEAGNAEFWNALGVVTTEMNVKISQHSFVRSLHLNERNAHVWTNLGTLYLTHNDIQLANDAFTRAQSADPEYAHAWLGQGLLALLVGDQKEARLLFTHAFEISDSSSILTRRQYALSIFDHVLSSSSKGASEVNELIQPLFALQQLLVLTPNDTPYQHLSALYSERIGDFDSATETLTALCSTLENQYENTESPETLARFCIAKADLARTHLANHNFHAAVENASTAIDLSEDATAMSSDQKHKCRLSAHLTAGLAQYFLQDDPDAAISSFRTALEESSANPDVVCLLAQVLWAKGGADERSVARAQLLDCVEQHPGHVRATVLLGAIACLDSDTETIDAVRDDLENMRASDDKIGVTDRAAITALLSVIEKLFSSGGDKLREIQTQIMLHPSEAAGWGQLAEATGEPYPAEMALKAAARSVPPGGTLDAEGLAAAYAGTGTLRDLQRAIMTAPWMGENWKVFGERLKELGEP